MSKVYIDSDFKCHVTEAPGLILVEVPEFDWMCDAYIEGFRYVPKGETWVRDDGEVFEGEMLSAFVDTSELDVAQQQHERQLLAEYAEALKVVGVKA
jgi:hypothetical protein